LRIATWTIDRRTSEASAQTVVERIAEATPDIVCLAQAHEGSLASLIADAGGHVICDRGADWGGETATSRKLALWSKAPWRERAELPGPSSLGGAISAITDTDLGAVRVVGVCTPSPFASPGGTLPRPPHWSMHIAYLEALGVCLKALHRSQPTLIVGAFNQFMPLTWGAWPAHHALTAALSGFGIVTQGDIPPTGEQAIDHVAVSKHFRARSVGGLSRVAADGKPLTDQFGVLVELERGGVQIFD